MSQMANRGWMVGTSGRSSIRNLTHPFGTSRISLNFRDSLTLCFSDTGNCTYRTGSDKGLRTPCWSAGCLSMALMSSLVSSEGQPFKFARALKAQFSC